MAVWQLTDALKAYVEEKIGNGVHNQYNLLREVDVRMSVRGGESGRGPRLQRCEVIWDLFAFIRQLGQL